MYWLKVFQKHWRRGDPQKITLVWTCLIAVVHLKGVFSPLEKGRGVKAQKKVKETVFYEFRKDMAIDLTGFSFLIAQILIQSAIFLLLQACKKSVLASYPIL